MANLPKILYTGDKDGGKQALGFALMQLDMLLRQMELSTTPQNTGVRRVFLDNGGYIECSSVFGLETVNIYWPHKIEIKKEEGPEDIPVLEYIIAVGCLNDDGSVSQVLFDPTTLQAAKPGQNTSMGPLPHFSVPYWYMPGTKYHQNYYSSMINIDTGFIMIGRNHQLDRRLVALDPNNPNFFLGQVQCSGAAGAASNTFTIYPGLPRMLAVTRIQITVNSVITGESEDGVPITSCDVIFADGCNLELWSHLALAQGTSVTKYFPPYSPINHNKDTVIKVIANGGNFLSGSLSVTIDYIETSEERWSYAERLSTTADPKHLSLRASIHAFSNDYEDRRHKFHFDLMNNQLAGQEWIIARLEEVDNGSSFVYFGNLQDLPIPTHVSANFYFDSHYNLIRSGYTTSYTWDTIINIIYYGIGVPFWYTLSYLDNDGRIKIDNIPSNIGMDTASNHIATWDQVGNNRFQHLQLDMPYFPSNMWGKRRADGDQIYYQNTSTMASTDDHTFWVTHSYSGIYPESSFGSGEEDIYLNAALVDTFESFLIGNADIDTVLNNGVYYGGWYLITEHIFHAFSVLSPIQSISELSFITTEDQVRHTFYCRKSHPAEFKVVYDGEDITGGFLSAVMKTGNFSIDNFIYAVLYHNSDAVAE